MKKIHILSLVVLVTGLLLIYLIYNEIRPRPGPNEDIIGPFITPKQARTLTIDMILSTIGALGLFLDLLHYLISEKYRAS
jgi:hypothetical protein